MSRLLSTLAAASMALFPLGAAIAQAPGAYYVAVPATPKAKPVMMTRATAWTWQNGAYVAQRAPERDGILCELVARDAGKLASFTVAGKAYDADALAKCNAKAR